MTVSCPECATKLRLKDRRAVGKRVKCPKCEVPFLVEIPAAGEEDPLDFLDDFDAAPPSRARSRSDEESDDVDDAPSKPKRKTSSKKKKKRRKSSADWQQPALIGGGVLLLLLLLGGGVYLATGTSINGNAVDMTYLPADADTLVKIDVAEIAQAPLLNPMMQNEKIKAGLNEFSQKVGISLSDIDSITMGIRSTAGGAVGGFPGMPVGMGGMSSLMGGGPASFANGIGVVRLSKAVNPQTLVDADPASVLVQHSGRNLIRNGTPPGQTEPFAALFATDTLIIIGQENAVKAAYDAGTIQVRRPEFDFVNPDMQLFYAYVPRDRQVFKNMAAIAPVPEGADKHVMEYTIGMGTGIDFNSDVDVEVWYSLESRSAASSAYRGLEAERKQAREAVDNLKKLINEQNAMLAMMAPNIKPSAEKIIAIAEQTVDSMSGSKSGSYYTMELTIPGSIGPAIQELVANMP
ncbi:MAG: MJ0042-type zinc finger domain-containing protein, partial [Planctomycetaceae bacterium]